MAQHEDISWTLFGFKQQGEVGLNERSPKLAIFAGSSLPLK